MLKFIVMETATAKFKLGEKSTLTLEVNEGPVYIKWALGSLTVISFLIPIITSVYAIFLGGDPHLSYLIIPMVFGYFGVYLLKASLWHSNGEEEMNFSKEHFSYIANYGYFKGSEKRLSFPYYINYEVVWQSADHLEGVLTIYNDEVVISSALKLPIDEMEKLYVSLCDEMPWLVDPALTVDGMYAI